MVEHIADYIRGRGIALRYPPASESAIEKAERELGFSIPTLLKECYRRVGNGGFGPGLGVIGVEAGYESDFGDLARIYKFFKTDDEKRGRSWPTGLLPLCEWGCAMFSCVACDDLRVSTWEAGLWPQQYGLEQFFEMWMQGVDIPMQDPSVEVVDLEIKNPFTRQKQMTKVRRRRQE